MKIIKLKFKNLNSLKGEWEIDFEELAKDGIFAITGATGSGKSTILDAISLALYAQTPRHKTISKSSNEIMTKGTGECFAEVEFRGVENRIFRSRFEQHRANKNPSGNLQEPRVLLEEVGGKSITTKKREWDREIERVSGLNFERFIRSILLAQGNFALFLKSDEKKKSEILEQITGTTVYKAISKRVYEKFKEIEIEFNELKLRLNLDELIDEKERKRVEKEKNTLNKKLNKKEQKLEEIQNILREFENLNAKEEQLELKINSLNQLKEITKEREFRINKWIVESRAELKGLLALEKSIIRKKDELKLNLKTIKELNSNLKIEKSELQNRREKKEDLDKRLEEFENSYLIKNRLIDILEEIKSKILKKDEIKKEIKNIEDSLGNFQKINLQLKQDKEKFKKFFEFERYYGEIKLLKKNKAEIEKEIKIVEDKIKDKNSLLLREIEKKETLKQRKKELEKKIKDISLELERIKKDEIKKESLTIQIDSLKLKEKNRQKNSLQKELNTLKKEVKKLKDDAIFKELESLRANLKEGEPCPVCGSIEHPWRGRVVEVDLKRLDEIEDKIKSLEKEITLLEIESEKLKSSLGDIDLDKVDGNLSLLEDELIRIQKDLEKKEELIKEKNLLEIDLSRVSGELDGVDIKSIERETKELKSNLELLKEKLNQKIKEIKNFEDSIGVSLGEFETKKDILDDIKKKEKILESEKEQISIKEAKKSKLLGQIEELEERLNELNNEKSSIKNRLKEQDYTNLSKESLENEKALLMKEKKRFEDEIEELENKIKFKEQRVEFLSEQNSKIEKEIQEEEAEFRNNLKNSLIKSEKTFNSFKMIDEDSYQEKKLYVEKIEKEKESLENLIQDLNQEIYNLKKKLEKFDKNELNSEQLLLKDEMNQLREEIAKINYQLQKDDELRDKNRNLTQKLNNLKEKRDIFEKLNALIGQADGSKFAKFAQTLTMDYLLLLANAHLKRLNPRYEIAQNPDEFLDLIVIDTFQANSTRGVETLSGGESFLVSLALALGLSDLAGDKIKVETLFLDEGFGTLDSNTLESVLDTLDRLRAQNKMIGLISHIETIKERIPTQIEVSIDSLGIGKLDSKFKAKS